MFALIRPCDGQDQTKLQYIMFLGNSTISLIFEIYLVKIGDNMLNHLPT